jgi:serine/threonine-protein kinase
MILCASCGREIPSNSRFCLICGAALEPDATPTVAMAPPAAPSLERTPSSSSSPSRARSQARFAPGDLLGGRYRIVALLGKGGMGEVYRAEDLTLEQPVALKFLPEAWARNEDALARFRNEVRVARQVSHPNVCRVYDLGELDGLCFLSMEYVDGEDLGSLLRRIGRLPADKAIEIARKLCAGLAAAHEKGVLHRDLKPANIMLDSRGQVLLTDFGLAGIAGEIEGRDVTSGTPAYMAPEQLAGEEVTVRSDIYSLGLVLYEIFTGKLPFESETLAGLKRARLESAPPSLTTLVKDVDPLVERVILRCLQTRPAARPGSALAVAAALPGGDPLAAALAAGETPSPEMVAAAGEGEGLAPRTAIPLLVAALACSFAVCALVSNNSALSKVDTPYSPEVLAQKARDLTSKFGWYGTYVDDAWGFQWSNGPIDWFKDHDRPRPDWNAIYQRRPSLLTFWYRRSPSPLTAWQFHNDVLTPGMVGGDDPPNTVDGMTYLELDPHGNLIYLEGHLPQLMKPAPVPRPEAEWDGLFIAAGLDRSKFQTTEPLWTWPCTSDQRMAWTGVWPGTQIPLRVEAATMLGVPVGFFLIGPWSKPWRGPSTDSASDTAVLAVLAVIALVVCTVTPWLAWKNLARGRGDRRGAFRLACFLFCAHMAMWLTRGHIVASVGTFAMFLVAICTSVFGAMVVWTMYLALEPYVRRNWPRTLIGWTSAFGGHWKDSVVGRDILVGFTLGAGWTLLGVLSQFWKNRPSGAPMLPSLTPLSGLRPTLGDCSTYLPYSVRNALLMLFLLFLLRAVLRKPWLAAVVFTCLWTSLDVISGSHPWLNGVVAVLVSGSTAFALLRWGVLSLAAAYYANFILFNTPVSMKTSAWYFGNVALMLGILAAIATWSARTAMRGHKLFQQDLFS